MAKGYQIKEIKQKLIDVLNDEKTGLCLITYDGEGGGVITHKNEKMGKELFEKSMMLAKKVRGLIDLE